MNNEANIETPLTTNGSDFLEESNKNRDHDIQPENLKTEVITHKDLNENSSVVEESLNEREPLPQSEIDLHSENNVSEAIIDDNNQLESNSEEALQEITDNTNTETETLENGRTTEDSCENPQDNLDDSKADESNSLVEDNSKSEIPENSSFTNMKEYEQINENHIENCIPSSDEKTEEITMKSDVQLDTKEESDIVAESTSIKEESEENIEPKEEIYDTESPITMEKPEPTISAEEQEIKEDIENLQTETESKGESNEDIAEKKEEEKEEQWVDVLGTGALLKKTIKKGSGEKPTRGECIFINLQIFLKETDKLIESYPNLEFVVGDGDVIQAIELAVTLMQIGEEAEVLSHPKLCETGLGKESKMPTNVDLKFVIKLLSSNGKPDYGKMSAKERYIIGDKKRERGNLMYTRGHFTECILIYSKALTVLNSLGESPTDTNTDLQALIDVKIKCYSNLAAAQLKIKAFEAAEQSCTAALTIQPNNVKALFRKAKAVMNKGAGDLDLAAKLMKKAIQIDPNEKAIQAELQKLTTRIEKQNKSQKEIYQRMFGGKETVPEKEEGNNLGRSWLWLAGTALAGALVSVIIYKHVHS
ncbi:DgyrCDS5554 [Dimorphilus gyrociliatus]|uniref:peptidylprolyl isomerase n=1 Tax=Dimorphilus gyrociliatus TaxID=2664684 RepID=A0A7I8VKW7_9ANNE|nr:DgyrCDS5554 [Dimorphilus gyrociliatus]